MGAVLLLYLEGTMWLQIMVSFFCRDHFSEINIPTGSSILQEILR